MGAYYCRPCCAGIKPSPREFISNTRRERETSDRAESAQGFREGQSATERPDWIEDEHLEYLDELRESGETNMFGACPYIESAFPELGTKRAAALLSYWMKTFRDRHPRV